MLNRRSDKLELLRIAEAVALEKSIDKELIIVENPENINTEINLEDAVILNEDNKDKKIGDEILQPLPSFDFGRIPQADGSFSWEKTDKKGVFSK